MYKSATFLTHSEVELFESFEVRGLLR